MKAARSRPRQPPAPAPCRERPSARSCVGTASAMFSRTTATKKKSLGLAVSGNERDAHAMTDRIASVGEYGRPRLESGPFPPCGPSPNRAWKNSSWPWPTRPAHADDLTSSHREIRPVLRATLEETLTSRTIGARIGTSGGCRNYLLDRSSAHRLDDVVVVRVVDRVARDEPSSSIDAQHVGHRLDLGVTDA